MRDRFPWYFLEQTDIDSAWEKGVLTVDANVILDLYRYNKSTRDALLAALESFKGRFWISHQTAKEFIKNRRVVITDMNNEFDRAKRPIDDVEKATSTAVMGIRGCRVIPEELSEEFKTEILKVCKSIRDNIEKERVQVPDYEKNDEIVHRLEAALDGQIGNKPKDITEQLKEAERRKKEEIPPGYLDGGKDGLGFAGDYLMWSQILTHSQSLDTPMILVTSEAKEDWWEKKSGMILNPRLELLQEAFEKTKKKILIYHTDQFLRHHQERNDGATDETVLEEIREYALARVPAVSVSQDVDSADSNSNCGRLRISIARPLRNFTGTGRFFPRLVSSPDVSAELVECPDSSPGTLVTANTGTTFDFNVHVISSERNKMLPVGDYLLKYEASIGLQPGDPVGDEVVE